MRYSTVWFLSCSYSGEPVVRERLTLRLVGLLGLREESVVAARGIGVPATTATASQARLDLVLSLVVCLVSAAAAQAASAKSDEQPRRAE